jgi:hypothetical protein
MRAWLDRVRLPIWPVPPASVERQCFDAMLLQLQPVEVNDLPPIVPLLSTRNIQAGAQFRVYVPALGSS